MPFWEKKLFFSRPWAIYVSQRGPIDLQFWIHGKNWKENLRPLFHTIIYPIYKYQFLNINIKQVSLVYQNLSGHFLIKALSQAVWDTWCNLLQSNDWARTWFPKKKNRAIRTNKKAVNKKSECCEKSEDYSSPSSSAWALSRDNEPHPRASNPPTSSTVRRLFCQDFCFWWFFRDFARTIDSFTANVRNIT